jgi:ABC-type molybdate transport system substrate-binding protein
LRLRHKQALLIQSINMLDIRRRKQEAARRFAAYVSSPEGQALLERYGYRKPL